MKKILFVLIFPVFLFLGCNSDDDGPSALPQVVEVNIVSYDVDNNSVLLQGTEISGDLIGSWTLESNTDGAFVNSTTAKTTFNASLFETHSIRWSISNGSGTVFKDLSIKIGDNFTLMQLIEDGVELDVLLTEYSIQDIVGAGLSIQELLDAGLSVQNLIDGEVTIPELIEADVTINQLTESGVTIQELLEARVTIQELLAAEIPVERIIGADVTITELLNGGVTIEQLIENDFTIQELLESGVTVEELLAAGVTVEELIDADVTVSELVNGGASINQLLDAGITIQQLLAVTITVEELISAGVTVQSLIDADVETIKILQAGVSSLELVNLGVTARQLIADDIIINIPGTDLYVLNYFREKYSNSDAVNFCDALVVGETTEWRLPSISEMRLIFNNRDEALVEFTDEDYWSSTFANDVTDDNGTNPHHFTKNMTTGFESTSFVPEKRILPIMEFEGF